MRKLSTIISFIVLSTILLTACSAGAAQTASQQDLRQASTSAAQTIVVMSAQLTMAAAQLTATQPQATFAASETPAPTDAPTAPATQVPATPSIISVSSSTVGVTPLATYTSIPQISGSCELISVSPPAYTSYSTGGDFDSKWVIKNSGSTTWKTNEVDFEYISGTKMYKSKALFDLSADVLVNNDITLIVDSIAPKTTGTYTTTWGLVRSGTKLCTMSVTIIVK